MKFSGGKLMKFIMKEELRDILTRHLYKKIRNGSGHVGVLSSIKNKIDGHQNGVVELDLKEVKYLQSKIKSIINILKNFTIPEYERRIKANKKEDCADEIKFLEGAKSKFLVLDNLDKNITSKLSLLKEVK